MKLADVTSFPSEQVASLPATVAEIGKIHFEGNIIPHQWYQHVRLESGKPDLPAIVILAEIVYWYRPYQTLDKRGKPILRKHFDGDLFQCTAAYFSSKFGLTKDQTRKALKRLEDAGLIRREYRDIVQQGILRNNIMFIEPVPLAILSITHPVEAVALAPVGDTLSPVGDTLSPVGDTLSPVGDTLSPVGDFFNEYETTTEISPETATTTTTPNPSSSNRQPLETEPTQGGSGGNQDTQSQNPKGQEPADNHGIAAQEPNEKKRVFQNEEGDDQLPELIYPAKLTTTEQQDIETQLQPLPPEIAQQMLDVLESRMQSGEIKTNPAALLRGIIRKYKADSDSFDPSSGFQIAENRRRRAVTAARLEASRQESFRRQQAIPERRLSEFGRASIAAMLGTLRGGVQMAEK